MADGSTGAPEDQNPLKLEDQLCFALYSTSRAITKQYAAILADMGVTYPQYIALLVLWEHDGLTVHELARHLELEGATTTPLVQRLEKLGLVERRRSTEDERRVHIHLTRKGKTYRKKALKVPEALGCALNMDPVRAMTIVDQMNRIKADIAQGGSGGADS